MAARRVHPRRNLVVREPQDELRGLERDVELRAVPDAVELDPVGVGEPLLADSAWPPRATAEPVGGTPHDPHGAVDPLGVELVARAQRELDQRSAPSQSATPRMMCAISSAGMCS